MPISSSTTKICLLAILWIPQKMMDFASRQGAAQASSATYTAVCEQHRQAATQYRSKRHVFIHSDRSRSERADIGGARSAGTGVYIGIHEDGKHRAPPMSVCAVDLCCYVWRCPYVSSIS